MIHKGRNKDDFHVATQRITQIISEEGTRYADTAYGYFNAKGAKNREGR